MHLHLLPVSSRGALGVKRGKEGMGCHPSLGSQHEAEEGTLTPHPSISFIPDTICITANLIIILCTFRKIYGFELLLNNICYIKVIINVSDLQFKSSV